MYSRNQIRMLTNGLTQPEPLPEPENLRSQIDGTEADESLPETLEKQQNAESSELPPEGSVSPESESIADAQGGPNEEAPPPEGADLPELELVEAPGSQNEAVDDTNTTEPDNGEIVIVDEGEAVQSGSPLESMAEPPE